MCSMSTDWTFRKLSRVSCPGGFSALVHDADIEDSSTTDENEFHYEEVEDVVNETDV